ncbi:MAG: Tm-1-like ATP-binding domain-containing protein [Acidobacteria bacterium]|nr:Tm-1-like ATP-binding domain-containing protein [Acidobacteriota bacterium]
MTTTELADEVCGGVLSAVPNGLESACRTAHRSSFRLVVLTCALGTKQSVPPKYAGRHLYEWTPNVYGDVKS